jgi:V8-like Glu-specific endopeptidase
MGAGFYIQENLVATARHVVDSCTRASIENNDHKTTMGTVLIKDSDLDIAFIKTDATVAQIVTIDRNPHTIGEPVSIVGAPIDGLVLSSGKIKDFNSSTTDYRLALDIPADHGNSGGPVFSERGLIGVIVAKSDFGTIYAYDSAQIDEVLAAEATPRTSDVQDMLSSNSQLENLLLTSILFNVAFLVAIIVLVAQRKRFNKNQVVINL